MKREEKNDSKIEGKKKKQAKKTQALLSLKKKMDGILSFPTTASKHILTQIYKHCIHPIHSYINLQHR